MHSIEILNVEKEMKEEQNVELQWGPYTPGAKPYPRLLGEEGTTSSERERTSPASANRDINQVRRNTLSFVANLHGDSSMYVLIKSLLHLNFGASPLAFMPPY